MSSPFMTAWEAVAWIVTRDQALATEARDRSRTRLPIQLAAYRIETGAKGRCSTPAAERLLLERCAAGRIVATGVPGIEPWVVRAKIAPSGTRRQVPAHVWSDLELIEAGQHVAAVPKLSSPARARYLAPLFRRDDVVRCFPAWEQASKDKISHLPAPAISAQEEQSDPKNDSGFVISTGRAAENIGTITYRTGTAGRPSSKHIVASEIAKMCERGQRYQSQRAAAQALASWLSNAHPEAAPASAKTIETELAAQLRTLVERPKIRLRKSSDGD